MDIIQSQPALFHHSGTSLHFQQSPFSSQKMVNKSVCSCSQSIIPLLSNSSSPQQRINAWEFLVPGYFNRFSSTFFFSLSILPLSQSQISNLVYSAFLFQTENTSSGISEMHQLVCGEDISHFLLQRHTARSPQLQVPGGFEWA